MRMERSVCFQAEKCLAPPCLSLRTPIAAGAFDVKWFDLVVQCDVGPRPTTGLLNPSSSHQSAPPCAGGDCCMLLKTAVDMPGRFIKVKNSKTGELV